MRKSNVNGTLSLVTLTLLVVILSFIDHQRIESRFKFLAADYLAHQTRNDFTKVKFAAILNIVVDCPVNQTRLSLC